MKTQTREFENFEHTAQTAKPVLTGLLVGGIIGAAAALLFAPRSGEETRSEIRNKAIDLRDRTTETVNERVSQVKSRAHELKDNVWEKADEIKQRGKQVVDEQLDRVSQATKNGKKKIEEF